MTPWYYKAEEVFKCSKNRNDVSIAIAHLVDIGKWYSQFSICIHFIFRDSTHLHMKRVITWLLLGRKKNCPSIYISECKFLRQQLLIQDKLKIILCQELNITFNVIKHFSGWIERVNFPSRTFGTRMR